MSGLRPRCDVPRARIVAAVNAYAPSCSRTTSPARRWASSRLMSQSNDGTVKPLENSMTGICMVRAARTAVGAGTLTVQVADDSVHRVEISTQLRALRIAVPLRQGKGRVGFSTTSEGLSSPGDPRDLRFALLDARVELARKN